VPRPQRIGLARAAGDIVPPPCPRTPCPASHSKPGCRASSVIHPPMGPPEPNTAGKFKVKRFTSSRRQVRCSRSRFMVQGGTTHTRPITDAAGLRSLGVNGQTSVGSGEPVSFATRLTDIWACSPRSPMTASGHARPGTTPTCAYARSFNMGSKPAAGETGVSLKTTTPVQDLWNSPRLGLPYHPPPWPPRRRQGPIQLAVLVASSLGATAYVMVERPLLLRGPAVTAAVETTWLDNLGAGADSNPNLDGLSP